eukprot:TRINITY_DN436_c0_g1_i1.p1 TRINITY_DN436_c0_g1~~TRINITY_DN436_c0_g1_i1.p1  ORF type:complete len:127 (+),score=2.45 TRINITY_DN436_c0_g1_i1:126-506(+)
MGLIIIAILLADIILTKKDDVSGNLQPICHETVHFVLLFHQIATSRHEAVIQRLPKGEPDCLESTSQGCLDKGCWGTQESGLPSLRDLLTWHLLVQPITCILGISQKNSKRNITVCRGLSVSETML